MIRFILISILFPWSLHAQKLSARLTRGEWPAEWITVPGITGQEFGVYHFRKVIRMPDKPGRFMVHVSADNRYKLFVNEQIVSLGPASYDPAHWNFETVDLAPYLRQGNNVIAALVWNFANERPYTHMSLRTGFLLQGNEEAEDMINTGADWKCTRSEAFRAIHNDLNTFLVVGPGEEVDYSGYAWNWLKSDYNDSSWSKATAIQNGMMWNPRTGSDQWTLVQSTLPQMERKQERLSSVRVSEGVEAPADFLHDTVDFRIPAMKTVRLIIDQQHLTTAYPVLVTSGGKGATIQLSYAESMFEKPADGAIPSHKGNRNEVEGKVFFGVVDRWHPDGGSMREMSTLWWRTYRYIELRITTAQDPLTLHDLYGMFTAYPLERKSKFHAEGRKDLDSILDIGWRTARLCAHETYMDCPYYEQLQYAGDVRLQLLISMYNTSDDRLVRNAIMQLRNSMASNGLTMSRYPSTDFQFIPMFSLWWTAMLSDYWKYRGDSTFIRSMLPVSRMVTNYFFERQHPNGSLKKFPEWPFTDWTKSNQWGIWRSVAPQTANGESAPLDLQLLLALKTLIPLERVLGMPAYADLYAKKAAQLENTVRSLYWNNEKKLYSDTPEQLYYSQHSNILAILAGAIKGGAARELMQRILSDTGLVQTSIFFKYYLHRAVTHVGLGDKYIDLLGEWRSQMARGLTTWAETFEPSRSDCHAWGSTPNIEFFRIVLGIDSDAPGFRKVLIEPHLGNLQQASGSIPHPAGDISVSYETTRTGKLRANISLPAGITGVFRWKGKDVTLRSGTQLLEI